MTVSRDALKAAPHELIGLSITEKFSFERDDLEDLQLSGLKKRFDALVPRVSVLRRFAEEQRLEQIRTLEEGALLLFPHTMYKAYPLSAIENSKFDVLTRWLGSLTAIDVSGVSCRGCESIDDWIDALDRETDLRVRHSSGTSGKLSFVPLSKQELPSVLAGIRRSFEGFGAEPNAEIEQGFGELPLIAFGYRHGSQSFPRTVDAIVEQFYGGDESRVICLNPGRISADMASLAGRLEGAQQKGMLGKVSLSPGLLARREQFLREQQEAPRHLQNFFDTISTRFRGERVILKGVLPPVVETAVEGLKRGLEKLFDPRSLFFVAGGAKGRSLPADYPEQVHRFTNVPFPPPGYGMSEAASAITRMCPHGHYHIVPNLIPYLLDPDTGAVLPRKGTQTGRLGIIDIGCQTRWGGFLTGDEVTLNWGDERPCGCGRKGTFIEGEIRRYSELRGGDDKITCAGAPGIHDKALDFMASFTQ
ncbi:MAG: hypothetical protein ABW034_07100 [Steroidobacteraceae bacterium]